MTLHEKGKQNMRAIVLASVFIGLIVSPTFATQNNHPGGKNFPTCAPDKNDPKKQHYHTKSGEKRPCVYNAFMKMWKVPGR